MAFAESRRCGQWQACLWMGGVGDTLHGSVIYYFITDAYIPSIDAFPKASPHQHLKRFRILCTYCMAIGRV